MLGITADIFDRFVDWQRDQSIGRFQGIASGGDRVAAAGELKFLQFPLIEIGDHKLQSIPSIDVIEGIAVISDSMDDRVIAIEWSELFE